MIREIRRTPQARHDIINIYTYIYLRNPSAADKVLEAIEKTIRGLARFPGVGNQWESPAQVLRGVRYTTVTGYRSYLIFFREVGATVEIYRVVHGARDLETVVDEIKP